MEQQSAKASAPGGAPDTNAAAPRLSVVITPDGASVTLVGQLDRHAVSAAYEPLLLAIAARPHDSLSFDLAAVDRVDSAGVALLGTLARRAKETHTQLSLVACSEAARDAIALFKIEQPVAKVVLGPGMFEQLGAYGMESWRGMVGLLSLAADTIYLTFAGAPRTAKVRRGATWSEAVKVGVDALPIVGLIAFLIGVVVGLQSAAQLRQFGASIYVAKLISISMAREMGPLMTAIIIAGRSGASIAAEVATMQVSQEVDALNTMGLNPVRYIVVPKFLALTLTMPCLTTFAVALGIVGGYLVSFLYLDLSGEAFWTTALEALALDDLLLGLLKSIVFAWIIVLLAAHRGFQAHGGAESVGRVTTTSVVSAVFWVIVADAAFSLLFYFDG